MDSFEQEIRKYHRYANDEQIEFMRCIESDHDAVCEAVPGSGKTACVVAMAMYCIETKRIEKDQVLICAFNRDCADLIRQRMAAGSACSPKSFWKMARTYHSVGWEVCRALGRKELIASNTAEIYRNAMSLYHKSHNQVFPYNYELYKHAVGYMKNQGCFAVQTGQMNWRTLIHPHCEDELQVNILDLERMLVCYERAKGVYVDNDDQLLIPYLEYVGGRNPFNRAPFNKLKYLLVDELQDINEPQMLMIRAMQEASKCKVVAIGDRRQSVYAWRGANTRNIQTFIAKFNARRYVISWNYRSGSHILEAACNVANQSDSDDYKIQPARDDIKGRVFMVKCPGVLDECQAVLDLIRGLEGRYRYKDIYILGRTNAALGQMAKFLWHNSVPVLCRSDSISFESTQLLNCVAASVDHENAKMQDVLASIKLIGPKRAEALCRNGQRIDDIDAYVLGEGKTAQRVDTFLRRMKFARRWAKDQDWRSNYKVFVAIVNECIESLIELTHEYANASGINMRAEFLSARDFILSMAEKHKPYDAIGLCYEIYDTDIAHTSGEAINLMTCHRAKGLENECVIIIDANNFPCVAADPESATYEQETNLLFVAMTRAKEALFIFKHPKTIGDKRHVSNLLKNVVFDYDIKYQHKEDIQDIIDTLERKLDSRHDEKRKSKSKTQIDLPDMIDTHCDTATFEEFKDALAKSIDGGPGTFYLHRPDPSECCGKEGGGFAGFVARCIAEDDYASLASTYAHMMARTVKPEEERMRRQDAWIKTASCVLAARLGEPFIPDMWRVSGWVRQVRAQADFITPIDTGRRKLTTLPVICASIIAEVSGAQKLKSRAKLQVTYAQARLDPDVYGVYDLCVIDTYPLWPAPILIWESDREWSRAVKKPGEGFLPPLMAMIEALPSLLPQALMTAQQLAQETDIAKYWGLGAGGHLWIHKGTDAIWPLHPENTTLIKHSNVRYAPIFDPGAAEKERTYYNHIDGHNRINPACDIDLHNKRMRQCMALMPSTGIEYLVAKDLRVAPQDVESENTGMRLLIRTRKIAGMRQPSPRMETALSAWTGRSCKVKILL